MLGDHKPSGSHWASGETESRYDNPEEDAVVGQEWNHERGAEEHVNEQYVEEELQGVHVKRHIGGDESTDDEECPEERVYGRERFDVEFGRADNEIGEQEAGENGEEALIEDEHDDQESCLDVEVDEKPFSGEQTVAEEQCSQECANFRLFLPGRVRRLT